MLLVYNNIALSVVNTNLISRETRYDESGQDAVYTRWTIDVDALYNPVATGYTVVQVPGQPQPVQPLVPTSVSVDPRLGVAGALVNQQQGPPQLQAVPSQQRPVLTDWILREALMVQRKQLILYAPVTATSGEILLSCPRQGEVCDASGGPKPVKCDIKQIHGDATTFVVNYIIQCDVMEGRDWDTLGKNHLSPVISNRFSIRHDLDQDYFVTRVVQGVAEFDLSMIHRLRLNPDDYRPNLMLSIPIGYKRENVSVELDANGSTVRYGFVDRQQQANFINAVGATRVEAVQVENLARENDIISAGIETMRQYWSDRANKKFGEEDKRGIMEKGVALAGLFNVLKPE